MDNPEPAGPVEFEPVAFELDDGLAGRARIGLVALASDHTVEHELHAIARLPGVAVHVTRIANSPVISPQSLAAMEDGIRHCALVIVPGAPLDVIAYGCTSASIVLGEETVLAHLRAGRPEAAPTTPVTAALAAIETLGAKRIAVITPYSRAVNEKVYAYLAARNIEIPVFGSFGVDDDNIVARITPASIRRAIIDLGRRDDVDMVFLSCTSLRLGAAAAAIEAEIGKPVVSSNLALAWHCLRLAGIDDPLPEYGMLFSKRAPA